MLVAERAGKLVGAIFALDLVDAHELQIMALAVRAGHRRQGIANQLLSRLTELDRCVDVWRLKSYHFAHSDLAFLSGDICWWMVHRACMCYVMKVQIDGSALA